MYRVFIVHTPLHVLLALSLIKKNQKPSYVFIVEDFSNAALLSKHLPYLLDSESKVILLPGRASAHGIALHPWVRKNPLLLKFARHIPLIRSMCIVRSRLRRSRVSQLFVFNDTRPDIQNIIWSQKKRGCHNIFLVEDGIGAYMDMLLVDVLPTNQMRWLFSFVYGRQFERIESLGGYSQITAGYLTFPEYASAVLRTKLLHELPSLVLSPHELNTLYHGFTSKTFELPQPSDQTVLVGIPYSGSTTPEVKKFFNHTVNVLLQQRLNVLLKPHPLEPLENPVQVGTQNGLQLVDKNVPIELLVLILGKSLKSVYLEFSTAIYTIKRINPEVEVNMVMTPYSEALLPQVKAFFDGIDINMIALHS